MEEIGILKTIWKKNDTGIWCIHDIKGLDLKPQQGFDPDYFKIEDEVQLLTQRPGPVFDNIFSTFGTTEFLVRQSIVPIVSWNEGDQGLRCIGTGFFISASGLLLTAAHVIRDPVDEGYANITKLQDRTYKLDDSLKFGIMLPANPAMKGAPFQVRHPETRDAEWFVHPFEWAMHWGNEVESPLFHVKNEYKLDLDIAVCKVRENKAFGAYQPLNIGQQDLKIGDRAVAIGYAKMNNIPFKSGLKYQPELVVSVGSVTNVYHDNITVKQTTVPGPCFEFDAKIPGKMSGSPILVGSGILTKGVVSRSWGEDEKHASGCLIAPIMGLELINKKSLLDFMKNGNEGIALTSGPDL